MSTVVVGQQFGKWTVIGPEGHDSHKSRIHLCRCSCGVEKNVRIESLLKAKSTQCFSCSMRSHTTHGGSYSRIYKVWSSMKARCYNTKHVHYSDYGGRGISVCTDWRFSFEKFREWALLSGYSDKLQIDRINNAGNYEPNNCRFVIPKQNTRNRRNSHMITAFGETKTISAWVEDYRCSVCWSGLKNRIKDGWPAELAISLPKQNKHWRSAISWQ
mgnify:CR=1 FL=1